MTRGVWKGGNGEKKEKGEVKENVQKTHGQGQWVGDCLWEQGWDRAGESSGGRKMGTTVTEPQ